VNIQIQPLLKESLPDFLHFFDNVGFTDNPDWSGCYCKYFHFEGTTEEWRNAKKDDNLRCSSTLIESGTMKGYLAYDEGQPVGWCNANAKTEYELFKRRTEFQTPEDDKIISVVCFVVAPDYRKKGLAGLLLKKVMDEYAGKDYQYIEAYPAPDATLDADNFHGPLPLFLNNNFEIVKEIDRFKVVRRSI